MEPKLPTNYDRYLFHRGEHYESYEFMGAHPGEENGSAGTRFTVWAPNAENVYVTGDFNNWSETADPMERIEKSGLWTTFLSSASPGMKYKYHIIGPGNKTRIKADPYGFFSEKKPKTASIISDLSGFNWTDRSWMQERSQINHMEKPMLIYEVHLGSWKRDENGDYLNYRVLAEKLIKYLDDLNFTHVELLPITEHPFDGSWGYQTTGYFSVTSRYGSPEDFMYFINRMHEAGYGVIIDWVPGHFCRDDHGLRLFDGTELFESADSLRAENPQWDTLNFDFAQPEVWSFLISNACFWFEKYHIDGIRADAVSNMLYLDYGREDEEWRPNEYGGRENIEAIKFLRKLNETIFDKYPGALMVAEEATSWPQVTAPAYVGGLGFNYKWNMGWMNDVLEYMKADPIFRKWEHNKMTFSLMYAFSENFILPLSHDEVVHGKQSLVDKMPGDYWQKFANLRLLYSYMLAHPGKNLLFMGGEFAQFIEWNYRQELDWFLLEYEKHHQTQNFVSEINKLYKSCQPLWKLDHSEDGFNWIEPNDYSQSVLSFIRRGENGEHVICVYNFTPVPRDNYRIGVPEKTNYRVLLNTDDEEFGGSGYCQQRKFYGENVKFHGRVNSLDLVLPPLGALYLAPENTGQK